jgi:hypothetical protein
LTGRQLPRLGLIAVESGSIRSGLGGDRCAGAKQLFGADLRFVAASGQFYIKSDNW